MSNKTSQVKFISKFYGAMFERFFPNVNFLKRNNTNVNPWYKQVQTNVDLRWKTLKVLSLWNTNATLNKINLKCQILVVKLILKKNLII